MSDTQAITLHFSDGTSMHVFPAAFDADGKPLRVERLTVEVPGGWLREKTTWRVWQAKVTAKEVKTE